MKNNNGACYCFIEEPEGKYALTFTVIKKGIHTGFQVGIIDFITKEKLDCTEYKINSEIDGVSSFSVSSKNFSFSLEDCGGKKIIKTDYKKCLPHTALKASLEVSLLMPVVSGESETLGFVKANGFAEVKGRKYMFGDGSVGAFFTSSDIPRKSRFIGAGKTEAGLFAIFAVPENSGHCLIFSGDRGYTEDVLALEKGDFSKEWSVKLKNGGELSFLPSFNDRLDISRVWLNVHGDVFFGTLSGKLNLGEKELTLDKIKCLYGISS